MTEKQTIEPRTPKGMRDFLPAEKRVRDAVLKKMISVFESYGFDPLETPAVELKQTLFGKIGSEEKLIYEVRYQGGKELALRYDQTVPLARVVAQYDLPNPFKRYQIQNAYRADNTQKGRFREFLQVDIDTVGSANPLADAEIIACAIKTYEKLGFKNFTMLINSRTLLQELIGGADVAPDKIKSVIVSIDKLPKIGRDGVTVELKGKGLTANQVEGVLARLDQAEPNQNLRDIFELLRAAGIKETNFKFEPTLARGLDYYTGAIFECVIAGYSGGAVGGGGRYDNLIGNFSKDKSLPAVGFAFGFEPVLDALRERGLLKELPISGTKVLVTVFDEKLTPDSIRLAEELRQIVPTELYTGTGDLEKQLRYADLKGIPYVAILGPKEVTSNLVTIKDLAEKSQRTTSLADAIKRLS